MAQQKNTAEHTDPRLPVVVVAGYLGAGKTTLINQVLHHNHGLRLMVLVNDFGAINIDAELLDSADEDTLKLSNGCVCCTLGGDLYQALWDVLGRTPRPDAVIIEASGVAQPEKIAQAAIAEPDMRMEGIITVADALNYPDLAEDRYIGVQVRQQITAAHLLLLGKQQQAGAQRSQQTRQAIQALNPAPVMEASPQHATETAAVILSLLQSPALKPSGVSRETVPSHPPDAAHAEKHHTLLYQSWSWRGSGTLTEQNLRDWLHNLPAAVYRLKGRVRLRDGSGGLQVHVVGRQTELQKIAGVDTTCLVAIACGEQAATAIQQLQDAFVACVGRDVTGEIVA